MMRFFDLPLWGVGLTALILALLLLFVVRILTRRRPLQVADPDLTIDLGIVAAAGPPLDGPVLEFYNVPVRLVVLVLAPAGRGGRLPPADQLPAIVDQLVPNMKTILDLHQPIFRSWPAQLSAEGFARSLFTHVQLPGSQGKGTPWCSLAGRFTAEDQHLLAGIVCCADRPNSLSQLVVERESQWLDILRIRT